MNKGLQKVLDDKGLTAKTLSEKSILSYSSIMHALDRPTENWKVSSINKFAIALNMTPTELLSKLQDFDDALKTSIITYSDKQLKIQGYKFAENEEELYQNIKNILLADNSGYIPTKEDIENLVYKFKFLKEKDLKDNWEKSVLNQLLILTQLQ